MKYLLLVLSFLTFCQSSNAEYTPVDGDSLVRGDERIRLKGIDAPELYQYCYDENGEKYDCGRDALEFLKDLTGKGEVRCKCQKQRDRYKRKLCECFVSTLSLNREMVASGYAVTYKSKKFVQDEEQAKTHKYGIWRGKFMRPSIYRALEREKNKKR